MVDQLEMVYEDDDGWKCFMGKQGWKYLIPLSMKQGVD